MARKYLPLSGGIAQIVVHRGRRRDRRSHGRGYRSVRRLRCMGRFIPFQGNYSHPASPDGAPGNVAAPSAGSTFSTALSAAQKIRGRAGSVARS